MTSLPTVWTQQAASQTALDALKHFQWSVFPLDEDKRPPKTGGTYPDGTSKRLSWKHLQTHLPSPKQVLFWQRAYSPSAWAVITGAISRLIIGDFDGEAGRELCRRLGLNPHVQTGSGGYHVYFQYPGWRVATLNGKSKQVLGQQWPGLDIRADGGYAAFCGRNSHGPYTWLREPILEDLSVLPEDLRMQLGLLYPPELGPKPAGQQKPANELLAVALERSSTGRNDAGFWLACQLRDNGYSQAEARDIMQRYVSQVPPVNSKGLPEPYSLAEALQSLNSAYKRAARAPSNHPAPVAGSSGDNATASNTSADLPCIIIGDNQLRERVDQSIKAIVRHEGDSLGIFVQSSRLVSVGRDKLDWPIITQMDLFQVREVLTQAANFYRSYRGEQEKPSYHSIPPPDNVAQQILARRNHLPFPHLDGLVEVPIVRPDGSILDQPGYDSHTRLYYAPPPGSKPCRIPTRPTSQEVTDALALIRETLGEFPYADREDYANTLGLMMTPILRPLIQHHVPLALLDAPKPGTGKGLLVDVNAIMTTGRAALIMPPPTSEEEWEKRITAILMQGQTIICIDNVRDVLQSATLDAVLTCRIYTGRVLGQSTMVQVPNRATWIATGNNIKVGGDLIRRSYRIRLDPEMSRPWTRTGFRHEDLIGWVVEQRMALIQAFLILIRAWCAAGQPKDRGVPSMGTFNHWARTVGSILAYVGVPGFLGNLPQLYEIADETATQWETFLQAWFDTFGSRWIKVGDVVKLMNGQTREQPLDRDQTPLGLAEALPEWLELLLREKPATFKIRFGQELKKRMDECFGESNLRLQRGNKDRTGAFLWRVVSGRARREF